jgi:hypothetical protein
MTDAELAQIEARWAAATPGEWERHEYTGDVWWISEAIEGEDNLIAWTGTLSEHEDAEAIAHAPTDIQQLVAEVRRLRGLLTTVGGEDISQPMAEAT